MGGKNEKIELRVTPAFKASTKQAMEAHPDADSISRYVRIQIRTGNKIYLSSSSST